MPPCARAYLLERSKLHFSPLARLGRESRIRQRFRQMGCVYMRARRCDGRTGREEVPGALCCISTLRKPVTGHARREPLHVAYSDDRVLRAQSWPFHAALRGTRHPWTHTCSTTSWLSPRTTIDRAPCRTASSSPIMSPVYSASLFVAPPRYRPPVHTHTLSWYNIAPEFEPVSCCRTFQISQHHRAWK